MLIIWNKIITIYALWNPYSMGFIFIFFTLVEFTLENSSWGPEMERDQQFWHSKSMGKERKGKGGSQDDLL
jgi:hypothetical protein